MLWTVLLTEGVAKGRLAIEDLARVLAWNPARLFGLWPEKGHIAPGADADLVLVDPEAEWVVRRDQLHSRGEYTIYEGMKARGRVALTMARGVVVHREGEFVGRPGAGRYLKRGPSGLRRAGGPAGETYGDAARGETGGGERAEKGGGERVRSGRRD